MWLSMSANLSKREAWFIKEIQRHLPKFTELELSTPSVSKPGYIHLNGHIILLSFVNLPQLRNLPPEIEYLEQLTELYLDNTAITEFPENFKKLTNLRKISYKNGALSRIPPAFLVLPKLQTLDLANNQITFIPKEICTMNSLQKLNLEGNPLEKMPSNIFERSKAVLDLHIDYSEPLLTGFPESFVKLIKDRTQTRKAQQQYAAQALKEVEQMQEQYRFIWHYRPYRDD
jgi:hypothetical protein